MSNRQAGVVACRFDSSYSDGVIPKPRVFSSGARDLPQNISN
jgi:hypothetical protein